jgi:hypothetical protein
MGVFDNADDFFSDSSLTIKSVSRSDISYFYVTKYEDLANMLGRRSSNVGGGWGPNMQKTM